MTPTELDQFLVDYHKPSDYISVQCEWLQQLIRSEQDVKFVATSLEQTNTYLLQQLDAAKAELLAMQYVSPPRSIYTPSSYLNVKA